MGEQRTQDKQRQQESPLKTERGNTTIQDGVVYKIAGMAAEEVDGVRMGGGGTSEAVGGALRAVPGFGGASQSRGVSVEVGEVETAVELTLWIEYGRFIPQIAESVRINVSRLIENLTGLKVTEVTITVTDVFFPQQEEDQQQQQG